MGEIQLLHEHAGGWENKHSPDFADQNSNQHQQRQALFIHSFNTCVWWRPQRGAKNRTDTAPSIQGFATETNLNLGLSFVRALGGQATDSSRGWDHSCACISVPESMPSAGKPGSAPAPSHSNLELATQGSLLPWLHGSRLGGPVMCTPRQRLSRDGHQGGYRLLQSLRSIVRKARLPAIHSQNDSVPGKSALGRAGSVIR